MHDFHEKLGLAIIELACSTVNSEYLINWKPLQVVFNIRIKDVALCSCVINRILFPQICDKHDIVEHIVSDLKIA